MRKPRDEAILNALASEIKSRRNGLGISQDELAFRADLSRTFVGKMELAQSQPALNALFQSAIPFQKSLVRADIPKHVRQQQLRVVPRWF